MAEWWDVTCEIGLYKDWDFHLSFFPVLTCSNGSQLPCWEIPYGEVHIAKNWGGPLANTQQGPETLNTTLFKEWNPFHNHLNKLGLSQDFEDSSPAALWQTLSVRHPAKRWLDSRTKENCRVMNVYCLKQLCFVILCYTEVVNDYGYDKCILIKCIQLCRQMSNKRSAIIKWNTCFLTSLLCSLLQLR